MELGEQRTRLPDSNDHHIMELGEQRTRLLGSNDHDRMELGEQRTRLLDSNDHDRMELGEQRTRLLDSNDHDRMELGEQRTRLLNGRDRLDFADIEQNLDHNPLSDGKGTLRIGWLKRNWRGSYWRDLVAVAVLVGIFCGVLGYTLGFWAKRSPGRALRPDIAPLRILVAGDSISQGCESMHTWRYRLWEWFQANNVPVTFVGPFHQTRLQPQDLSTGVPLPAARHGDELDGPTAMDNGYAFDIEPEFLRTGSAHFSIWGREIAQDVDMISQQIREYRPDYLLVELGLNDLAWASREPDEALLLMEQFIDKARATSPELRFAVANVPQRSKVGDLDIRTGQYNEKLREAIPKWSLPSSPVELVELMEAYSCGQTNCPAGLDGIHPNSRGEFEIAHAFSKTLYHNFGIGRQPLALPAKFPIRTCLTPATVAIYPSQERIRFTWDFVYGAYGYEVQVQQEGIEWVIDSANFTQERHLDTLWTTKGTAWKFRVRTYCESTIKSAWTHAVSTTMP